MHQANIKAAIGLHETGYDGIATIYLVNGKKVESSFGMKSLPGTDLEASPAPGDLRDDLKVGIMHQPRDTHNIDIGLGGHYKGR